jgi:hypothetical protein
VGIADSVMSLNAGFEKKLERHGVQIMRIEEGMYIYGIACLRNDIGHSEVQSIMSLPLRFITTKVESRVTINVPPLGSK